MGQTRTSSLGAARPLPPSADIGPGGQSVGQAAQFCLADSTPQHLRPIFSAMLLRTSPPSSSPACHPLASNRRPARSGFTKSSTTALD